MKSVGHILYNKWLPGDLYDPLDNSARSWYKSTLSNSYKLIVNKNINNNRVLINNEINLKTVIVYVTV